ncbi:MAG: phosphatidate cytidylyltransferase, partial [Clostridiales bacterium]
VYFGGWVLLAPIMFLGALAVQELFWMLPAMTCRFKWLLALSASLYIAAGFTFFVLLRLQYADFRPALLLLLTVWITDIGAYEIGRRVGKHLLAPKISPHKTWEGAISGLVFAVGLTGGYAVAVLGIKITEAVVIVAVGSVAGQLGDLLESKIKRLAGVKDSGKIFPGHGGVLDRFDSILLAAPVLYLLLFVLQWQ